MPDPLAWRNSACTEAFSRMQPGCVAAGDEKLAILHVKHARLGVSRLRANVRHRLAPDVAFLRAKFGVSAGPRSESAHAIKDLARRQIPMNPPVLFFQDWRVGGRGMIFTRGAMAFDANPRRVSAM